MLVSTTVGSWLPQMLAVAAIAFPLACVMGFFIKRHAERWLAREE